MTVKELIKKLSEFYQDLPVMIDYGDIEKVYLNEEHYFGDPANPNCEIGCAVEIV